MTFTDRDDVRNAVMTLGSEKMVKLGKAIGCEEAHTCVSKGELATYIAIRIERLILLEDRVNRLKQGLREIFP